MKNLKKLDRKELREIRFNDKFINTTEGAYYILSDAIVILKANEKEQQGRYIQEKETARLQRAIFDLAWKNSKGK